MSNSIQMRKAFDRDQVNWFSTMERTARLEQALAVMDFKIEQDYDEVRWSVLMTDFAVRNRDQFGYFL